MTDIRADDAASLDNDDRLPWLEAVEEDEGSASPSPLKLIVAVLIGLVALGGFVAALFWLQDRGGGSGSAEVIKAPEGAYKVRPDDPGGMDVPGEGDTAFAATQGADPKGNIDTNAVPEQPVTKSAPKEEPLLKAPAPTNATPKPAAPAAPAAPAPAGAAGGATIQLGAFSSQAGATNAWKAMSGRFAYLSPLTHNVVPVTSGGKTLYRLRASGPGAANLCGRLRVAGESCVKVD